MRQSFPMFVGFVVFGESTVSRHGLDRFWLCILRRRRGAPTTLHENTGQQVKEENQSALHVIVLHIGTNQKIISRDCSATCQKIANISGRTYFRTYA